MQFRVPQFIEYETKIIGPLTYRQALFVLLPAGVTFLLYLTIAKTNFPLFLFLAIILMGGGLALAFVKIEGRPLPIVIVNFFKHSTRTKTFIWKKWERPIMKFEIEFRAPPKKEESPLQIIRGSKLGKAKTKVETQTR